MNIEKKKNIRVVKKTNILIKNKEAYLKKLYAFQQTCPICDLITFSYSEYIEHDCDIKNNMIIKHKIV